MNENNEVIKDNKVVVKKSNKKIGLVITIIIFIILAILSIPKKYQLKDGGTVIYEAKIWKYSEVHSAFINGYAEGSRFELFGIKIFDNVKKVDVPRKNKDAKVKDNSNKNGDTKIDSNTNNQSQNTITETDEDIVKKLFINEYLQNPQTEKLLDYRIDKVQVLTGSEKEEIVNMGYEQTDILASVTYSVKVNDPNTSDWNAGNGEGADGQWLLRKTAVVAVRNGKLHTVGTGW